MVRTSTSRVSSPAAVRPRGESLETRRLFAVPALDTGFSAAGVAGVVTESFSNGTFTSFTSVVELPDGKILAAGQGPRPGRTDNDLIVARYNSNGTPDTTFNGGVHHRFFDPFGDRTSEWTPGVLLLPNGSFLVSGGNGARINDANGRGFIAKFSAGGALDTSFGTAGIYVEPTLSVNGTAVQGDKILLAGPASTTQLGVARLTAAGRLDTTFGTAGRTVYGFSSVSSKPVQFGGGISVRADQSFVVSSVVGSISIPRDGLVVSFTAGGAVRSGFGRADGRLLLDYGGDEAPSASLKPNGSLSVSIVNLDSGNRLFTGTVSPTGVKSALFTLGSVPRGSGNIVWFYGGTDEQADGKVLGFAATRPGTSTGPFTSGNSAAFFRARSGLTGLDTTFGNGGAYQAGNDGVFPSTFTLDRQGRLLVAGVYDGASTGAPLMLARYRILEAANTAVIRGSVFNDKNRNGTRDGGEALANVPVYIDRNNNNAPDAGDLFTQTDVFGGYSLTGLAAGSHTVRIDSRQLTGLTIVTPASGEYAVTLATGQTVTARNFILAAAPEVDVRFGTTSIADGDATPSTADGTDFGTVARNATPPTRTFTVRNTGGGPLTTGGLVVPSGFTVTEGLSATIAPGASDTITIRLNTGTAGTFQGDVRFANNDANENPYNFRIKGVVAGSTAPAVGILASDPNAGESLFGPPSDGQFTLYRRGGTAAALTIELALSGSAAYTSDFRFAVTGGTFAYNATTRRLRVTLAAGSAAATILVRPVNDSVVESTEAVTLTLVSQALYAIESGRGAATVNIADKPRP